MTSTLLLDVDVIDAVLAAAMARGADFAEIFVEDSRSTMTTMDQQRVEDLTSSRSRGAGVRVIVGSTTGYAHTADLSLSGLLAAAEAARAVAQRSDGGATVVAVNQAQIHDMRADINPSTIDRAQRIEVLRHADDVARSHGAAISQVQLSIGDSSRQILVANSRGLLSTDHQVRSRLFVSCVASGDTGLQTGRSALAATAGFELFAPERIAETATKAARQAITKMSARPAPSGDFPIVLANGFGGVLFHEACGHGLEADAIVKKTSVYADRVGELVASPLVTLVDDGTCDGEWGAIAIDDEGAPATRNVLIEDGVLSDYMWDYVRANQEGRESSGNGRRQTYRDLPMVRMTNTFLENRDATPEHIISDTPYGIYVAALGGGQVDTSTGDFVFGMTEAYLIENGEITAPLREANLVGNGPDVLARVDAVANDFAMAPGTCGKWGQQVPVGSGQPTMRLTGMTVGGTAA
jgi:TldD protein